MSPPYYINPMKASQLGIPLAVGSLVATSGRFGWVWRGQPNPKARAA